MKSLLLLLFYVFISGNIQAQIVDIPDPNLRARMLSTSTIWAKDVNGNNVVIDANNNGQIEVDEALAIYYLNIANANISDLTGIEAFVNLEEIFGQFNPDLTTVDMSQNINLKRLNFRVCWLAQIDLSQNIHLEYLTLQNNSLNNLDVSACTNLLDIWVSGNELSTLDVSQNTNLKYLRCSGNNLTTLNVSQNLDLESLEVSYNNLTNLDITQNSNLEILDVSNNSITAINVAQNPNFNSLHINNNQISNIELSQLPNLSNFNCEFNFLTELDLSNNTSLNQFNCWNNQITYLNIKNGINDFGNIWFGNNPIEYICSDESEILAFQELTNFQGPISSYCSFVPGGDYNTISGDFIFDMDNNGCDVSDFVLPTIRVNIDDGTTMGSTFSNQSGNYTFYAEIGSYQLSPEFENPNFFNTTPLNATIDFTDLNNIENQDFCITANGIHNDVEVIIVPILAAQPGFDAYYQIVYKNKGNQVLTGSLNFSYDDSVLDLISTSIAPAIQTSGNLSWDYMDLLPFENRTIEVTLNVNSPMENPAINIDDVLDFTATINPVSGDDNPDDNVFEFNQTVIGSYDPNDITCLEGNSVSPDKIGEYLHYNINFENTGTAAATFVVVKDVIDESYYDLSSLQIMYASHAMQTRVVNNSIEFIFDNINLGLEGKGNVVFKIKTNNTLTVSDYVENDAEIFFDYNFLIETNLATTSFQVLSLDEFENEDTILVFPNPSNDIVTLSSKSNLKSIQVYDTMSRLVFEASMDDSNYNLNVSNYSKGIYFLKLKTALGEKVERFIRH